MLLENCRTFYILLQLELRGKLQLGKRTNSSKKDQVSQVKHWKNECEKQQKLRFKVGCKPIRKKQLGGLVLVVSVCSTQRKALNWLEKTSEHLLER